MASITLKTAFNLDVSPILAMARVRNNGAADPIGIYRESQYRTKVAEVRLSTGGSGLGID